MGLRRGGWKVVGAFIAALVFGAVLGSVIQTQLNLLALQNLGVEIGIGERLQTSLQDIVNFAPLYGVLFGVSFLLSQTAALLLGHVIGTRWQAPVCALAAAVGLWLTFNLADALAPMPTLIAATRGSGGLLAMLVGAGLSGWLFARLVRVSSSSAHGFGNAVVLVLAGGLMLPEGQALAQQSTVQQSTDYRIEVVAEGLEHPWSIS